MKNSIVILYPYFGPLPWYFSYFVNSCRYNPEINFYIFSDSECTVALPGNVTFIDMSFEEFRQMANEKLGMKVNLPVPYKCCDLRPAFGQIFNEYTGGFDFWGHGDIDVIFGNIKSFLTDEILSQHDILSVRHDYLAGWFTLYRNTPEINNMFRLSKDYLKIFTNDKYYNFDETNLSFQKFTWGVPYKSIDSEVESMTHVVKKLQEGNKIRAYFNLHAIEGLTGKIKWTSGDLVFKNKYAIMLYHLLELKKVYMPQKQPAHIPEKFYISASRIYH